MATGSYEALPGNQRTEVAQAVVLAGAEGSSTRAWTRWAASSRRFGPARPVFLVGQLVAHKGILCQPSSASNKVSCASGCRR